MLMCRASNVCNLIFYTHRACKSILNVRIIFSPHLFAHPHSCLCSSDPEFAKDFRVYLDKFLHSRFHIVMSNECKLAHIRGGNFDVKAAVTSSVVTSISAVSSDKSVDIRVVCKEIIC